LNCPGSFQAIQALPAQVEIPSEYAEYGTAMHAVMDHVFVAFSDGLPDQDTIRAYVDELIGDTFHDRALTHEHVLESISPALDDLYELMETYGGGFRVGATELRVKFPGIAGGFGTSDLLLISKTHALLVDWKFGAGVAVRAVYADPALGDIVNAQLLFYLTAAIATSPKLFTKRQLVGAIIQPRVQGETCSHTVITRKEIKDFQEDVENAIIAALDRDPPLHKGDWCRWCPAKPSCPKWTGPLLDLTALGRPPALSVPAEREVGAYGEYLAKAKALLDHVADLSKEVDAAMHAYLEQGGTIPGWKLKLKTKLRQWLPDNGYVAAKLHQLGFSEDDVWQRKLQTFKVAETAAKRLGVKIPDELRVAPVTNETTLARSDDPAPAVDRALLTEQFAAALKQLRNQSREGSTRAIS